MAKVDWTQTGTGGAAIVDEGGSLRCQINSEKLLLWNGRNNLINSQIVADFRVGTANTNSRGGMILRSDGSHNNCYRLLIYGPRVYYIQKVVSGVATTIAVVNSSIQAMTYVKTRFTVDGYQLSVEEYIDGSWILVSSVDDISQSRISGFAGIFGISVTGYVVYFDNVEIRERI